MKGDITSNGDLRIDGILIGNINCTAKVIIGANGVVEGEVICKNALYVPGVVYIFVGLISEYLVLSLNVHLILYVESIGFDRLL